jgi:hypothetical protein
VVRQRELVETRFTMASLVVNRGGTVCGFGWLCAYSYERSAVHTHTHTLTHTLTPNLTPTPPPFFPLFEHSRIPHTTPLHSLGPLLLVRLRGPRTVFCVEYVVVQPPCLVDTPQCVRCHFECEISAKNVAVNLQERTMVGCGGVVW